jgi:hypothetical protein
MLASLFPVHFKSLYPGHPKLDSYIFSGPSGGDTAALKQLGSSSTVMPTAALKSSLAAGLKGPGGFMF